RPSGNSVLAGVHITESIRNGFLRGGKESFILPENFNPLPNYYHCTDIFYGMNMYRALVDLESYLANDPAYYVENMVDFLERESWLTPDNYHKMRFLGNHDTVSWVWQCGRAVNIYGVGGAKALFAMISLIDGVPMIYQGDEDSSIIGENTEKLTDFFTDLFHARKKYIPRGSNKTSYLHTGTPVMAFYRETAYVEDKPYQTEGTERVLVLINMSNSYQDVPNDAIGMKVFHDNAGATDSQSKLAPFSFRILGGCQ
ncbi:MAG: alpha-amylase family glycosyl hydrolase, partial [Clostridia bacterium]|nr:alpha-amylase family glycosyl hydrolase [Clostridia bacterium]